jgi:Phosphopantetheine attachment site.
MEQMKEKLLEILKDLRAEVEFEKETKLIDDGILDSFDIVTLVAELNAEFDIEINVMDLEPDNFNTVNAMLELIEKLQEEG